MSLAHFQDAFAHALRAPDAPDTPQLAALVAQPAFAVYRNTVTKACIDALQANYPAVARLVGDEWFRAAAAQYVRATPPDDPTLLHYGSSFADFLAHFAPAQELPYLPGVARLDRLWTAAHAARNEPVLDPAALSALTPEQLAATVLYPHAAARWAWFSDAPVFSIWAHNRARDFAGDDIWQPTWQAEGGLLTRGRDTVEWIALDAAGYAFIEVCSNGATLAQAGNAALTAQPGADLALVMTSLLRAGAFNRMSITRLRGQWHPGGGKNK